MQIPTNPFYDISYDAVVRLISSGNVIPECRSRNGRRSVQIRGKSHKPAYHPLDRLMLNTYKPLSPDKDPEWMSVKFYDGNKDNVSIENIEWSSEWYRPSVSLEIGNTWVPVYGYPLLEIRLSPHGVLIRRSDNWREIGYNDDGNYLSIKHPGTNVKLLLHRLVALTFLPHPVDTDHLTVNHKDSDKKNNWPYNLEWATYSENNFHAYNEGPRSETVRRIISRNQKTGEEIEFAGFNEAARYLGVAPGSIHSVMDRRTYEGRPYKGHVFKYSDDKRTWEELARSGPVDRRDVSMRVACMHMDTRDVFYYKDVIDASKTEDINTHALFRLLKLKDMIPWKRKCFQQAKEGESLKWPQYPEGILKAYEDVHASDKPICVTGDDGSVEYYSSVSLWCNEDKDNRCDPAVLSRYLKKNKGRPYRWRNWVFTYIDLSKYLHE